ncbi:nonstructural protein [Munia coronavirus HKU13-3514]|uniref:Nonstructural protein n=1 Tax=Munia coronavirus HKU13 TaxID=1297661 RepID=B6VDZ3_9NIDO|nr:nonstructural protein [Munia coronavirus HKU13-3514]ACJ12068.1 nonstructural protein [Munia coronavirus HKU13-3514]
MGTSQSTTNVNNQITNIHASHDSAVNTNNSNQSDLQALLQQGLPWLVIILALICLLLAAVCIHLLRRIKRYKTTISKVTATKLIP